MIITAATAATAATAYDGDDDNDVDHDHDHDNYENSYTILKGVSLLAITISPLCSTLLC